MIYDNVVGTAQTRAAKFFAQAPELWAAVRRYAAPGVRVANNPQFLADVTPWPVNISWALLANRSSCFANHDLAAAYAPLSPERRETINAQFVRVFAGERHAARRAATWRPNMIAKLSLLFLRTGLGKKTRSPQVPTIASPKAATIAGGFMCAVGDVPAASNPREPVKALLAPERLGEGVGHLDCLHPFRVLVAELGGRAQP